MNASVFDINNRLLDWYDRHARVLPWRSLPGQRPEPYHVWLSEIMLQQTTVPAVKPYFDKFLRAYPTITDLAAAPDDEVMRQWAGLGYYARARNLLKCAREVAGNHGGMFPGDYAALKSLPGIGDYTAAAIMAIAFGKRAVVVDGNVERVIARVYAIATPLPAAKKEIYAAATPVFMQSDRPGDLAQAFMDLGSSICLPKKPSCAICPLAHPCIARSDAYPVRAPKVARPKRHGLVYWLSDGQTFAIEKRHEKGLLGGMAGLPTSAWVKHEDALPSSMPGTADTGLRVRHVFTHFELVLHIYAGPLPAAANRQRVSAIKDAGMPSLFVKAANLMKGFGQVGQKA